MAHSPKNNDKITDISLKVKKGKCVDNNILYSIESFPPLPESINKINSLCSVEDIDLKAIIQVIESDPILYTDILRFSNVPYHGFRYPITSISQAIALFGIAAIRGMSLTAALKAHPYTDLSPYGMSIHEWFSVMEKQQRFLDLWLVKKHRSILQSLGGLTFILEIGRLVASYALMLNNISHVFLENESDKLLLEEKKLFGKSGDELASKLFDFWNFDEMFTNSLYYSFNPEDAMDSRACAALKCARTLFTLKDVKPFEEIESILEKYDFKINDARVAYEILLSADEIDS
ncbi:MAG: HDOD domain-containing protein [Sulfuricurvum sp.]|uniref:HDOD domain-containing protein n=1 Tax=Sulfuricurvum sp. TaxID=2025608 RepID=UPI00260B263F|nr:HDOD domain-containing protein [Sulfuricurvum sp.]MDD2950679.1 HDOD domain-containing protein [Sulfuricurvum sp.]MDD5118093.1 HDOD domain-containing protein [Sulfuricurvum sp.]